MTIPSLNVGDTVHVSCRKDITNKKSICFERRSRDLVEDNVSQRKSIRVRSKEHKRMIRCMFCCVIADHNSKECGLVSTDNFTKTILKTCNERKDEWAYMVKGKIEYYMFDLHAFDVIYHHQCYFNFVTKKYIPHEYLVQMDVPIKMPNLKPRKRSSKDCIHECL